ncbi:MAG: 2-oxoglutarate dehydrogenase E1 subunit family protein, partial [Limisphaerales bacterium]
MVKDVPVQLAPGRHTESLDVATFSNLPFIEELYADYMRDPGSLTPEWREYFDNFVNGDARVAPRLGPSFKPRGLFSGMVEQRGETTSAATGLQDR